MPQAVSSGNDMCSFNLNKEEEKMEDEKNKIMPLNELSPETPASGEEEEVPPIDWQPAIDNFKWENADQIVLQFLGLKKDSEKLNVENSESRRKYMTYIISVCIVVVGALTYHGDVPGEAFTGFLGVLIGHLLSKR